MRCKTCGQEIDMMYGAIADYEGFLHHKSCWIALETEEPVEDLDRDVKVVPNGDNVILVDFRNKKRVK